MNRKWSWHRDGNTSFVVAVIIGQAAAKHALSILGCGWEHVRKLLVLIARRHTGLWASRWERLAMVRMILSFSSSSVGWGSRSFKFGRSGLFSCIRQSLWWCGDFLFRFALSLFHDFVLLCGVLCKYWDKIFWYRCM